MVIGGDQIGGHGDSSLDDTFDLLSDSELDSYRAGWGSNQGDEWYVCKPIKIRGGFEEDGWTLPHSLRDSTPSSPKGSSFGIISHPFLVDLP